MENALNKTKENITKTLTSFMSGNCYLVMIYLISIIFLIIFTYSLYLRKELTKHENSLKDMKKIPENDKTSIRALDNSDYTLTEDGLNYSLIDYNVFGSFNSCCTGEVINGYVSIDALKEVIKQGVRLLDFEIYFKDGKAVVAAGRNNIYMKDTYNELEIGTVLHEVKKSALRGVQNSTDPLILNFRIVSKNSNIFHILEKKIMKHLSEHLASLHLSNSIIDKNILTTDFKNLKNKVLIFINDPNNNFKDNKNFNELVNAHGGQGKKGLVKYMTDYSIQNEGSPSMYIEENKLKFTITTPNVMSNINSKWKMHHNCGVQGVLMNFGGGYNDDNLKTYRNKFLSEGKAFILKNKKLRRKRQVVSLPPKQDKDVDPKQIIRKIGNDIVYFKSKL